MTWAPNVDRQVVSDRPYEYEHTSIIQLMHSAFWLSAANGVIARQPPQATFVGHRVVFASLALSKPPQLILAYHYLRVDVRAPELTLNALIPTFTFHGLVFCVPSYYTNAFGCGHSRCTLSDGKLMTIRTCCNRDHEDEGG